MTQKYEIFLSYSRRDLEQVKAIKDELEQATGVNCWMDLDGIESGEQFVNVIISAINRSDALLFMMSEASMQSEWALDELDFAKRKKPFLLSNSSLMRPASASKKWASANPTASDIWMPMPQRPSCRIIWMN